MARHLSFRAGYSLIVLWLVSVVTFAMIHAAPGGPAILQNPNLSEAQAEAIAKTLGLNRPWPQQYAEWFVHTLRGDLGTSLTYGVAVTHLLWVSLGPTLLLATAAMVVAIAIGVPLGIVAATRPQSATDILATIGSLIGLCVPVFWLGIMLIFIFSVHLHALPAGGLSTVAGQVGGIDLMLHLIMPAIVLGASPMAQIARYTRSSTSAALSGDYVRTARAKGLARRGILYRHVLRNAAIPIVSIIGLLIPRVISNAAVTEAVFAWPGLGDLAVTASLQRDYPVIMGVTLLASVLVVVVNFLTDLVYSWIDPRIKVH